MNAFWLDDPKQTEISGTELNAQGITYQALPPDESAYQPPLDRVKADNGYVEQDVIQLNPDTPNLEGICAQFKDEHLHTDDEVRFVLSGEGIFDIRSGDDRWMRVTVSAGDLIVVPKDRYHRFFLTDQKHIRCVRLFQDTSGWTPVYRAP